MKSLFRDLQEKTILTGQTSLATATPALVADVSAWQGDGVQHAVPPQFDIELWSNGSLSLSNMSLCGLVGRDAAVSSDDVDTVDFANNELDVTGHGLTTGQGPIRFTTTDTLPVGIEADTDYWVIATNANTIQIATSLENALEGTAVSFTDAGTGTHSFAGASAKAYRWLAVQDSIAASITLTATVGYTKRVDHRPRVVAYGLIGTHPGTQTLDACITPVRDR